MRGGNSAVSRWRASCMSWTAVSRVRWPWGRHRRTVSWRTRPPPVRPTWPAIRRTSTSPSWRSQPQPDSTADSWLLTTDSLCQAKNLSWRCLMLKMWENLRCDFWGGWIEAVFICIRYFSLTALRLFLWQWMESLWFKNEIHNSLLQRKKVFWDYAMISQLMKWIYSFHLMQENCSHRVPYLLGLQCIFYTVG